ncbi:MAG: TspO/MBR family protein [Verrucomicrobiia bacterium]
MEEPRVNSPLRSAIILCVFLVATFFVAGASGLVTAPAVRDWYPSLVKPSWTPPSWVFGPVWTLLYALMAIAAWLVWRKDGWSSALGLFAIQLTLNAAWSPLFFGLRRIDLALIDIVALWVAIVATIVAFAKKSPLAAWLLTPYLLWTSFASALNFTLWRLNS